MFIDDNKMDEALILETLRESDLNFEFTTVDNYEDFLQLIKSQKFDLVISDINIRGVSGIDILKLVKTLVPGLPLIFVTGTGTEEIAAEAIKEGAYDYVLKASKHVAKLPIVIKTVLAKAEDEKRLSEARKLLELSELRHRMMVESSPDAIVSIKGFGTIIDWNPAAENLFGYTKEEAIGNQIDIIVPKNLRSVHNAAITRRINGVKPKIVGSTIEVEAVNKTGDTIQVEISLSEWKSPEGTCFTAIIRDISIRKNAEKMLLKAKQEAEELNQLKSNFLFKISHELRTPFVSIMGYAELLIDLVSNNDHRVMIKGILRTSKRLVDTLNKILDLAKLDANDIEMQISTFSLSEIVYEAFRKNEEEAKSKEINLINKVEPNLLIESDRYLVRQILDIFVNNGVKYSDKGFVEVSVQKINDPDKGESIKIDVKDTGIGIPEEKKNVIWDEFRQAKDGITREYEGIGLGLSLVKRYAALLEGEVSLESEAGKGCTFSLIIPK
jgi:PAS domain S-box-containing protein